MEEILASIRKIIAEDPPGSRPVPEPAREVAPRAAPARDPFAAAFAAKPAAHEPVKAADPFAGLGRCQRHDQPDRRGPRERGRSRPTRHPRSRFRYSQGAAPQPATQRTRPTDIEDQMAEILGHECAPDRKYGKDRGRARGAGGERWSRRASVGASRPRQPYSARAGNRREEGRSLGLHACARRLHSRRDGAQSRRGGTGRTGPRSIRIRARAVTVCAREVCRGRAWRSGAHHVHDRSTVRISAPSFRNG